MFEKDKFLEYAQLLMGVPRLSDRKARDKLGIDKKELKIITGFFESKGLVNRGVDDSLLEEDHLENYVPGAIGVSLEYNFSKAKDSLGVWLKNEKKKRDKENRERITLLFTLFLGLFNFGFLMMNGLFEISGFLLYLLPLVFSLILCFIISKFI
jgi:hypothetical protein